MTNYGKNDWKAGRAGNISRRSGLLIACLLAFLTPIVHAADTDVLLIEPRSGFDASGIRTQLQNILDGAGVGSVNVTLISPPVSDQKSLSGWMHDLDYGSDQNWKDRALNLRGEKGTVWDYVVIMENPEVIENFPGWYAQGVHDVAFEVEKGSGEAVLLMQWPSGTSTNMMEYYREVTYRVGRGRDVKVVPAALARAQEGNPGDADSAYLAAASIYSRLWGQNASTSSYTYNNALAQTAFDTVEANKEVPQYSGPFTLAPNGIHSFAIDPILEKRDVSSGVAGYGIPSGTAWQPEQIAEALMRGTFSQMGFSPRQNVKTDVFSDCLFKLASPGVYPERPSTVYFPYRHILGERWSDDPYRLCTYVNSAASSLAFQCIDSWEQQHRVRQTPHSVLQAQMFRVRDLTIYNEDGSFTDAAKDSIGWTVLATYMCTMYSGRCSLALQDDGSQGYLANKVGYETAWRFATLHGRAPGFITKPLNNKRWTADSDKDVSLQVAFALSPKSNVTVNIETTAPFATTSETQLTFTPENYNIPQVITLSVTEDAAPFTEFDVIFSTTSGDIVYDQLTQSWPYTINNPPVATPQQVTVSSGEATPIYLSGTDPDNTILPLHNQDNLTFELVDLPQNGTVEVIDGVAAYKSNPGFTGTDSFTFRARDYGTLSVEAATVEITVEPNEFYGQNLLENGSAELAPLEDYGWKVVYGEWFQLDDPTRVKDGEFSFYKNKNVPATDLYQDVDVREYKNWIDRGVQFFEISGIIMLGTANHSSIGVVCFDEQERVLDTFDSGTIDSEFSGVFYSSPIFAPPGTVTMRVELRTGVRGYYDALSLVALEPENATPVAEGMTDVPVTSQITNSITLKATDADGDVLTYEIVQMPQHGTLTLVGDGPEVIYQTHEPYTGSDQFTFRASDGSASPEALVTLNVVSNQAPAIALNSPITDIDASIAIPPDVGLLLETTVTDDNYPTPLSLTWSMVSGTGTVEFTDAAASSTGARFSEIGDYVLRLTATDGESTSTHDVTVHYGAEEVYTNIGPFNSSGDLYLGNVGESIPLDSTLAWDVDVFPNEGEITTLWKLVSGPGTAVFADATQKDTEVVADTVGDYTIRFIADDGEIRTFTDAALRVTTNSANAQPTVSDLTVSVDEHSVSNAITLAGADADGDPLTYRVIDRPTHGTLGGTAPDLTYTPAPGYFGPDRFTYRVNDGTADSQLGTINITVTRVSLLIDAGPSQTVALTLDSSSTEPVPDITVELDAATDPSGDNLWTDSVGSHNLAFETGDVSAHPVTDQRFIGLTDYYEFPAAIAKSIPNDAGKYPTMPGAEASSSLEFILDVDSANGSILEVAKNDVGLQVDVVDGVLRATIGIYGSLMPSRVSYKLLPKDLSRFIHVVVVIDSESDMLKLYIDGQLKSVDEFLASRWAGDKTPVFLGSRDGGPELGSEEDFVGKIALFRIYTNTALSAEDVATNFRALTSLSATVNLDGTISGGTPTHTNWSVAEGPGQVDFVDTASIDTSATFTAPGRYVLSLSAGDGIYPEASGEVLINVLQPADYEPPQGPYRLTVLGGSGSGVYEAGEVVPIRVVPPYGYDFAGWVRDTAAVADPSAASTTITIDSDVAVKAATTPNTHVVTFVLGRNLTFSDSISSPYSVSVAHDSSVTPPTVIAATGYTAGEWQGGSHDNVTSDQTLTMEAQRSAGYYSLSVPNGTVYRIYTPYNWTYNEGTEFIDTFSSTAYEYFIEATVPDGYVFDSWAGDTNSLADPSSAYTQFTSPGTDATIWATFVPTGGSTFNLTVNQGTGDGDYEMWTVVPLSADIPDGYDFDAWTGDVAGIHDVESANTSLIMPGSNATVTATFTVDVTLSVTNGSGSGAYKSGDVVSIDAAIPDGYEFVRWNGDTAGVDDPNAASTHIIMPESDVTLEAVFAVKPPNQVPTVSAGDSRTVPLNESTNAPQPVAGALYEWDAAQDADGDSAWQSATANTYSWTFSEGLSPDIVSDSRFRTLTHAYSFPAAKSGEETSFWSTMDETASTTWEFVLDTDADNGLIMETGNGSYGIQFWIKNGILKGDLEYNRTLSKVVSYPLTFEDRDGFIHVVYVINVDAKTFSLYVNNVRVDSVTWEEDGIEWTGKNKAALGSFASEAPADVTQDFVGKIALIRVYENHAFTPSEVSTNFFSLMGLSPTVVSLDGNAEDSDNKPLPLSSSWSLVSSSPAGQMAWFYDATAVDTTAVFAEPGIYTLRLTASDGEAIVHDEVDIEVTSTSVVHTLSYTAGANGSISGTTSQTVNDGADGTTVTAVPDAGYEFVSWSDGSTNNPRTDSSVTSDVTVTANFDRARTSARNVPIDWLALNVPDSTNDYEGAVMLDHDGDGFATWQEYWCGTDPMDPESYFKIESIEYDGTRITIKWIHSKVDARLPPISILGCADLGGGAWSNLATRAPANGMNSWSATEAGMQFYRLEVTSP